MTTLTGSNAVADDLFCFTEGLQDTSANAANVQTNKMDIRLVLGCRESFLMI